ncbi:MAG: peroxidase family protein [Solirubrobacteraceae bacterium]
MTVLKRTKMVAAATSLAAAFALFNAGQASAASCASGSVDGPAPRTAMCFGTMFPNLSPFHYSDQAAADLAATMENPTPDPVGTDRGTADDSATLPAEYTYLGQFIDHNLDLDGTTQPTANVDPSSLTNLESFRFDLNNVFGGGPSVDPQLYGTDHRHLLVSGTLGTPQPDGFPTVTGNNGVFDLARNSTGQAILVEPRDDETQILSQISAAFVAFYNNFVNQGLGYGQARQLTEDYYQEIVLTDVLPAYVGQSTINKYLTFGAGGAAGVNTPNLPNASFTPTEFSVGAYRFGHALVRDNYHINDIFPTGTDIDDNVSIFDINAFQSGDLSGGAPLPGPNGASTTTCTSTSLCDQPNPAGHQIQWKYFVPELDANPNDPGINFARQTQPTISPALFNLPAESIFGCSDVADPVCNGSGSLISRDFARGNYDGLASGQTIARALGCHAIPASQINPTKDSVFNNGTPLIYYVLAEAKQANAVLGCVGASIVAQTFIQVLWDTPNSILHTNFRPNPRLVRLAPETPKFSFGDLLVDTGLAPRTS